MKLILGGTGFIGSNIAEQLTKVYPGQVRVMYRKHTKSARTSDRRLENLKNLGVELVEGDVLDPVSLREAMKGVDTVLDYAQATANLKNVNNLYQRINVTGTQNIVAAAKDSGVKRFILGSGFGTVKGESGSYMRTRWEAEEAVRQSGLAWTILQPSILFGKGAEFFEAQARLMKTLPIATIIGNGKTKFQPVFVEDVARSVVEILSSPDKIRNTIPVCGPEIYSYRELIKLIVQNLKKQRLPVYLPLFIARINAALFNMLPNPPLTPATLELFDFDNSSGDVNIFEKNFGFKPLSLRDYLDKNSIL
jgi:NADH dehydrogenase